MARLGFRKLSMNPVNIAQVKAVLSQIDIETTKRATTEARRLSSEKQVVDYITRYLPT